MPGSLRATPCGRDTLPHGPGRTARRADPQPERPLIRTTAFRSTARRAARLAWPVLALAAAAPLRAQTFAVADPVLPRLWSLGMDSSNVASLLQTLTDSIGPRLTGTPGMQAAHDWMVKTYAGWGVQAKNERVGTWRGWRRGPSHIDLVAPRVRSLEGTMLAWSPGTGGRDVRGQAIVLPDLADSAAYAAWMPQARGKFVLVSQLHPTCRADDSWERSATPQTLARIRAQRDSVRTAWTARLQKTGHNLSLGTGSLGVALERAGAAGVIASRYEGGWGVNKVFFTRNERAPALDLSCEDYTLLYRLAQNGQGPVVSVRAESQTQAEVPTFNTIATIRGSEKPDEYVVLSAHFDSWDAGSGATDNATGTVIMAEAMRLLSKAYPKPKRTIVVGHWTSEEQGLNGSRAYVEDHPEVVKGLQALFNQDNGTGRIVNINPSGLVGAGEAWGRWASRLPTELTQQINYRFPGSPSAGGSDNASFICAGAPAFSLGSAPWDYGTYTWHTNRDTYDKVSLDDVRANATLVAMLAYLASEDPETTSRERAARIGEVARGTAGQWPSCQKAIRRWADFAR